MKTLARGLIFVMFTGAGVALLLGPLGELAETGRVDRLGLLLDTVAAFALVFAGTELSERLKVWWKDWPKERDRERSRR